MGRVLDGISRELAAFLEAQPVFFVATAPDDPDGHVNCSPKGLDTFRVIDDHTVAYLDLTGSGVETVAHLRDNGRITLMFCAFAGRPDIVRLHGRGRAVAADAPDAAPLLARFPPVAGARTVIVVDVERVSSSCGFGVPRMTLDGPRDDLVTWAEKKGPDGITRYWQDKNATSIDGLPGIA
ncbi:MAG: pyridoxamine 5'-phosphate oxidase family protein [Actinobacteria bacterium]|nr:pyridoxamine 5'-phosphate oxidase family protein [Actinomycetota bacterium]